MTPIPVVDLFAGAGGLSLGAYAAGLDVRLHVDSDHDSCETIRINRKWWGDAEVLEGDVREITGRAIRRNMGLAARDPLVVIGGAPCQPFSKAAYWVEPGEEAAYRRARAAGRRAVRPAPPTEARPDARRDLVGEFWRIVDETNADGFVFENVPSLLHPRNRHLADGFKESAISKGFQAVLVRANAAEYGVAQTRERVFILAARGSMPDAPEPTHALPGKERKALRAARTAGQALRRYESPRYAEPEEVVTGRWAKHLETVPPGWNYKAHTAWGGHPKPTFVTETRFWSFLLKLDPDRPSWTVSANPGPWVGPFHWESRRLRTEELAALQGFPHGYEFAGDRRSRVRQIGNAVPAPLAERMIASVGKAVVRRRPWSGK